jgi:lipoprotein-releasing system permease protein
MSFESFVTRRYLRIKHQGKLVPLITVLSVVGVAVGVMVLVVVIAVMTGFQSELKKRILGIEAHMLVMRYSGWIENHRQIATEIKHIDGVVSVAPFVYAQGMLRSANGVSGIVLRGIDPSVATITVGTAGDQSIADLLGDDSGAPEAGIVLGSVLADKLNLSAGESALMMVVGTRQSNLRQLPRMQRLKVLAVFETGMHQYDGSIGYVHMRRLQKMLGIGDLATGLEVRLADADQVETVSEAVVELLGYDYWVNHWKQMHRNLFSMLALQKMLMYVILTLIIVVAAFNVASALIMMVREKTRDIAILKAMGASRSSLKRIFLGKGLAIGSAGVLIGLAGGLLVCLILAHYPFIELPGDVYFLTTLPVQITAVDLGAIVLGTMLICVAASVYPANQAAGMRPTDAIRYG